LFLAGVNGSGKTTTAGKIAEQFRLQNKSVILAASDTFRAAAVEQLKTWGHRVGAQVVSGVDGGDSAAVAFQAFQKAQNEGVDIVIVDTAGRLQNKKDLMEELTKTCRVLAKLDKNAPHQKVVVLDGTVGQNAHSQLESFNEAIGLTFSPIRRAYSARDGQGRLRERRAVGARWPGQAGAASDGASLQDGLQGQLRPVPPHALALQCHGDHGSIHELGDLM
jgi:signal recognition particle GTPase